MSKNKFNSVYQGPIGKHLNHLTHFTRTGETAPIGSQTSIKPGKKAAGKSVMGRDN
jgi:hypothetical protein